MSAQPATVVPFVVHGSGTGVAQHLEVPGSKHAFDTDAYPAFGGRDEAPSPLFYLLGSLISCNQVTAQLVAKDLGITLGRLEFQVRGDLDTAVLDPGAERLPHLPGPEARVVELLDQRGHVLAA